MTGRIYRFDEGGRLHDAGSFWVKGIHPDFGQRCKGDGGAKAWGGLLIGCRMEVAPVTLIKYRKPSHATCY